MKILLFIFFVIISIASPAQILNKLKNKVKGKAQSEINDAKYEAKLTAFFPFFAHVIVYTV